MQLPLQGNLQHLLETCRWKGLKPAAKRNVPFSKMWKPSSRVPPMPGLAAAPPSAPMVQDTKSITAFTWTAPGSFLSRGEKDAWFSIVWWHWWPVTAWFWCLRGCQVSQDFFSQHQNFVLYILLSLSHKSTTGVSHLSLSHISPTPASLCTPCSCALSGLFETSQQVQRSYEV